MDPISAIFVMTVLGGLFVKGVDVATDGWFSAEVGAGVRGAAGYAVRAERARWGRARAKAREIREQTPHGQAVQEMLDLAGLFGRTLFGELRRFGSGVRSEWETARDQARSARTGRRGDAPWPIVRAARSGAVRVREWAERRGRSGADVPNEAEPNGPNDPNASAPTPPDLGGPVSPVLAWQEIPHETVDDREEGAEGGPIGPTEYDGPDAYLPPKPGDPARQPVRVEIYRAYVERGQRDVRARVRCLDAGASYHAVKGHGARSGERGWTTFHDTGWLRSMAAVVAEVRATVLADLGRMRAPYRIEWFIDGEPTAQPASQPADGDPNDPNGDPNMPLPSTVPDANGDVQCGCCAQTHKPLPPGEHCPNCHIHDQPNAPTTKGPSMDINSAVTAIAAAEELRGRFEEPESLLASLSTDAISTLEGMGPFGTGDETDTAGAFQPVLNALGSARESWDVYVAALHEEWDEHIAAAEGRTAAAHAPFQEV
jgi:hypothetical protein